MRGVNGRSRDRRVSAAALGLILLVTLIASAARATVTVDAGHADYSSVPVRVVAPNGSVKAVALVGDTAYVGGDFTRVGTPSGSGVVVDAASGKRDARWPAITGGPVKLAVSDLVGGWYLAGDFTRVGSVPRRGVAHIRANRRLDRVWNPNIPGSSVDAFAVTKHRLYVSGYFTPQRSPGVSILAFDRSRGTVRFRVRTRSRVTALAVAGETLYFSRSADSNTTKNLISAADAVTGRLRPFRVRATVKACREMRMGNCEGVPGVFALAIRGRTIFAAGFFNSVNGVRRLDAAAFDRLTGKVLPWAPQPNNSINTMKIAGNRLYVGGWFTRIGGKPRTHLAALDLVLGHAQSWRPAVPGELVRDVAVDATTVYVAADAYEVPEKGLAAYDRRSGRQRSWHPDPNGEVATLVRNGGNLFVGGSFNGVASAKRLGLAAINLKTGSLERWNAALNGEPDFPGTEHPSVSALATDGTRLYVGGDFVRADGKPRGSLAAFNLADGSLDGWNPGADGDVDALAVSGSDVFAGGSFRTVGNQPHRGLAKIDATGNVAPIATSISDYFVLTLAVHQKTVYVGGRFEEINGIPRNNACAMDTSTGRMLDWNPDTDLPVWSIATSPSTVFLGGAISHVGGHDIQGVAEVDPLSGRLQGEIKLQDSDLGLDVSALVLQAPILYIGGDFSKVAGVPRPYLAAFDLETHLTTNWNPQPDSTVNAIAANNTAIVVGGDFETIGQTSSPNLAVFRYQEQAK